LVSDLFHFLLTSGEYVFGSIAVVFASNDIFQFQRGMISQGLTGPIKTYRKWYTVQSPYNVWKWASPRSCDL